MECLIPLNITSVHEYMECSTVYQTHRVRFHGVNQAPCLPWDSSVWNCTFIWIHKTHKTLKKDKSDPFQHNSHFNSRYFSPSYGHVETNLLFSLSLWHSFDVRIKLSEDIWCTQKKQKLQEAKYLFCYAPTLPSSGANVHNMSIKLGRGLTG